MKAPEQHAPDLGGDRGHRHRLINVAALQAEVERAMGQAVTPILI
jgi:hypothetical protein